MGYKCENAYHKRGDIKIYCKAEEMSEWGLCGCQYYCSNSFRNELSNLTELCQFREKNKKNTEK